MKALLPLFLALVLVWPGQPAPAEWLDETTWPTGRRIRSVGTDGTGDLWLVFQQMGSLFCQTNGRWKRVAFPHADEDRDATPLALTRLPDGTMACLWRMGKNLAALTLHRGAEAQCVRVFPLPLSDSSRPHLLGDSRGQIWITGETPDVIRLTPLPEGGWKLRRTRVPRSFFAGPAFWAGGNVWKEGQTPLRATEDGSGRIWLWADRKEGAPNFATLSGAIVLEGEAMRQIPLAGKRNRTLTVLAPKDAKILWLGVRDDGLYTVNIATGAVTPAETGEAFRNVEAIYPAGEKWLAVLRQSDRLTLWRLENRRWQPWMDPLEWVKPGSPSRALPRFGQLFADGSFLLTASSNGFWMLPAQGEPYLVDWQHGLPGKETAIVATRQDGTTVAIPPQTPSENAPAAAGRVQRLPLQSDAWETTREGHVWTVMASTPNFLSEWNGTDWVSHALPEAWKEIPIKDLAWEADGRLWILHDAPDFPILVFKPATGEWQPYRNLEAAALARRADPPEWTHPLDRHRLPAYGPKGEIAFLQDSCLHFYNGSEWRSWHRMAAFRNVKSPIGAPFFDTKGALRINVGGEGYRFTGKQWKAERPDPALQARYGPREVVRPDREWDRSLPPHRGSPVRDNRGNVWIVSPDGVLHLVQEGRARPLFLKTEIHPFHPAPPLAQAWIGAGNHAFVLTAGPEPQRYRIAPRHPAQRPELTLHPLAADAVKATLPPPRLPDEQFRWQLDDHPVQTTRQPHTEFRFLPPGTHRLRVTLVNDDPLGSPPPSEVSFSITVDPETQWAALIPALQAPDYAERKAAVAALARRPEEARSRLRAARETASGDLRWWIDAALTEIDAGESGSPHAAAAVSSPGSE